MAGSVNKAIILGNLGKDPDVRHTQDGRKIVNLSVATSESWTDKNSGEKRERTEWHRVVIFNEGLAGVAEKYLRKGSKVMLEGQIETRKWTDQGGQERYSTEIVLRPYRGELVLLGSAGNGEQRQDSDAGGGRSYSRQAKEQHTPRGGGGGGDDFDGDLDSEIPF